MLPTVVLELGWMTERDGEEEEAGKQMLCPLPSPFLNDHYEGLQLPLKGHSVFQDLFQKLGGDNQSVSLSFK